MPTWETKPNGAVATPAISTPLQLSERSSFHAPRFTPPPDAPEPPAGARRRCRILMSSMCIVGGTIADPSTQTWHLGRGFGRAFASECPDALLSL